MDRLQAIIAYFCMHYPHKGELSKARLTKLVYLADWFSALVDGQQMTSTQWLFNHYGPYVDDVIEGARRHPQFTLSSDQTVYGSDKVLISFNGVIPANLLSDRDMQILNAVIDKTKHMYFNDFIDYVYSTYPVVSRNRYSHLDLVNLAREYSAQSS